MRAYLLVETLFSPTTEPEMYCMVHV